MFKLKFLTCLYISIIFSLACNRNLVALDYTNAKGEVQQLGNLLFRFNKPLVPDSLINRWDSTRYISFEPAISGRFRWEHPDELIFSPARPLPPATTFTAKMTKELLVYSEADAIEKTDGITFSTPALKLENTYVSWVLESENATQAVPQVDLQFNYPVKPDQVKGKLQLTAEGKPLTYTVHTLSESEKISLRLNGLRPSDKDIAAGVQLEKGIVPVGGTNGTTAKLEMDVVIPSPYNLAINNISSEHDGVNGIIQVHTSQQIVMDDVRAHIAFEPAVKFSVEPSEDGFTITGSNFDVNKSYLLTLKKGLRGRIGGTLREQYDNNVAFGELEPSVTFSNKKSVYLSSKGNRNMEVRITNVEKVKVVISKIYESNILAAQRYGYYPKDNRNENEEEYYYYEEDAGNLTLGEVIYEQEIDTRSLPSNGNTRIFTFNPDDRLPDFKGIYHIKIRSTKDYWLSDSRFISMSDVGLIAKEGRDKMYVFANSIHTAENLSGVQVTVYGNNNQVLGSGSTNTEGLAAIDLKRKDFAGFRPGMIIAKSEDDFNYLPLNTTQVNLSRFEVGGKRSNATGLDAFLYAERDIYRPGEKINFSVILRDRQWKSPGELPVKMKFLMPNGKELKSFRKTLNEQGSLEGEVDIATSAITGNYTLEVYTSNDILLGTKNFNIEEFVPDRIRVKATLDKKILRPDETAILSIEAANFFGPPAANRNYETEIQVKPVNFNSSKYSRFNFTIRNPQVTFDNIVKEGKTNERGEADAAYTVPENFTNIGLLQAKFYATVFDETGRPVSRQAIAEILTQPVFFGIASDGYNYYALNQAVRFPLIALNRNDQVVNGSVAQVQVIKHEYRTNLVRNRNYFRYESVQDDKMVIDQRVTISGENYAYSFVPRTPGEYEIRIAAPGSESYVSQHFYSYGSWGADNSSFEVDSDGNIEMELDKTAYEAGDRAKILFKTPFSGKMLVTTETDKVLSSQYINVENRSASIDITLDKDHLPNVYVTATLFKPHLTSDIPLTVAHGFKSIRVEERSRKIPVQILAQKSIRSRTRQQVTVKAFPDSYVTLAAVDNGVLQISDFKTPDPYNHFYALRALEVFGYDLYPLLFPEINKILSSTGGDGEADMSKRVNPMPAKRVKVVSWWSGIRKTGGNGETTFDIDIPQFSGEVRLMAVAYRDEAFGSAEAAMTVADPLVLSTALPRFLSPNDSISVPVTISNTTSRPATVTATLHTTGPLRVAGSTSKELTIAPGSEGRTVFGLTANSVIGVGKVTVQVKGLGETFVEETEISVRPSAPLQVITGSGSVNGAGTEIINIPVNDFMKGSSKYQLVVGRNPVLGAAAQLKFLIQYPYGCTEQVISSAFPQLYFNDLAGSFLPAGQSGTVNFNIQEAIRKIRLRQLYNGAVTMWDGQGTEEWWITIYAAHFLLEAQRAGFDVDKSLLQTMLGYLNNRLKKRELINYYYNRDQQKKIAPKEVAYSLYVLALASQANVPAMNYYKATPAVLSLDSKYLLSVAYAVAGDKTAYLALLPATFAGEESVPQTGGSFYSDIRDEAIALNALMDVDPAHPQVPVMAKHVADKLIARRWYNTQESAFSLLALGKMARAAARATVIGEIRVNGKVIAKAENVPVKLDQTQLKGTSIQLVTTGTGRLYYYWQSEGISASGTYKEEDNYIKIRKQFFDRHGRMISSSSMEQNELIIVQLTLDRTYSTPVQNIVITDMLPAGFEIENPRTKEIPGMEWIKNAATPEAMDVRDDRLNLFVDLNAGRQVYYYAVRAVSPGTFRMGPVSAEAMYNGEYHSYHGAGTITIRGK